MTTPSDQGPEAALQLAVKRAGSLGALSRLMRDAGVPVSVQAIWQWRVCPVHRVLLVERLTGVSRERLRPDIYPPASGESRVASSATPA